MTFDERFKTYEKVGCEVFFLALFFSLIFFLVSKMQSGDEAVCRANRGRKETARKLSKFVDNLKSFLHPFSFTK